jgi:hypothetical protein
MLKKITSVDGRLVSDLSPMPATVMGPKSDGKVDRFAVFRVRANRKEVARRQAQTSRSAAAI